jgi:hypothetical protein
MFSWLKLVMPLILIAFNSPVEASAKKFTGEKLMTICSEGTAAFTGLCYGYILGVADVMDCNDSEQCCGWKPPTGLSDDRLVKDVVHEIMRSPQSLSEEASKLVQSALRSSFPC